MSHQGEIPSPTLQLTEPAPSRLLIVSNRLPISVTLNKSDRYEFSAGSGGLVTGLGGLSKAVQFKWYGWPGLEIPKAAQDELAERLMREHDAVPVFLDDELADLYYNKFANSILWPLLHYHPGEITFSEEAWQAYKLANFKFAQTVARDIMQGDVVWIHDYHLMLVPAMLRQLVGRRFSIKIGFFLHTPFPSSEIYRILPVRYEILKGLLDSDLIGFHTNDYARHFLSSCFIVLGLTTTTKTVTYSGRTVTVAAFPIGIDPSHFARSLEQPQVQTRIKELQDEFKDTKVMVGVDRLDYVKGIPQKLRAFEILLETHPEWVGKVVLIQVAIPTRPDVTEYVQLRHLVNELIGRINGKFGSFSYTPIHFMHASISFHELIALYAVSDVCVVASTRDGMNLVSFEYVACQEKHAGSLVLSEFAGSAQSLGGAIIVNPWNEEEMARAYLRAVEMGESERRERWKRMGGYVWSNTSAFWGESFIRELTIAGDTKAEHSFLQVSHDPLPSRIDWRSYDGEVGF